MTIGRRLQKPSQPKKQDPVVSSLGHSSCLRCGGLLVYSDFLNLMKGAITPDDRVIRCVQCGDLMDRIIFYNRSRQLGLLG